MRIMECGCEVRGGGADAQVVKPCREGRAVMYNLRWIGNWLITHGAEWDAYVKHYEPLLDGREAPKPPAMVYYKAGKP